MSEQFVHIDELKNLYYRLMKKVVQAQRGLRIGEMNAYKESAKEVLELIEKEDE